MTEPLTPADCDLRDFAFMPLDVQRLRDSDLAREETPEACWAAVQLWGAAWHQIPAGSLPDNDRVLANLAGYGRVVDAWMPIRAGALRGFVKCSDGRLYHPVVAAKAREAWKSKLEQRWRSECGRIKKANQRHDRDDPLPSFEDYVKERARLSLGTSPPVPKDNDQCPQGHDGENEDLSPPCPQGNGLQGRGTGTGTGTGTGISISLSLREQARADLGRMQTEAVEAAGDALASMAVAPGIASIAPLICLLKANPPCDWGDDILPAVTSGAAWHRARAGPGSMAAWTVPVRMAVENRDRRLAGLPQPQPNPRNGADHVGSTRPNIRSRLEQALAESGGLAGVPG